MLTNLQRAGICERYTSGEPGTRLASDFGVSQPTVYSCLERAGIARRGRDVCRRTIACDHAYFENISTTDRAYWLGFMAADANIGRNGSVHVCLSSKDENHLYKLRDCLGSSHPVVRSVRSGAEYSRISITSKQLTRGLAEHGVTPNKTFTLRWPRLKDDLMPHFARGYVDGDGGFYFYPPYAYSFSVTSNEGFLGDFQSFLIEHCSLRRTKMHRRRKETSIAMLVYCGRKQVLRIAEFLYEGASTFLPRKRSVMLS